MAAADVETDLHLHVVVVSFMLCVGGKSGENGGLRRAGGGIGVRHSY